VWLKYTQSSKSRRVNTGFLVGVSLASETLSMLLSCTDEESIQTLNDSNRVQKPFEKEPCGAGPAVGDWFQPPHRCADPKATHFKLCMEFKKKGYKTRCTRTNELYDEERALMYAPWQVVLYTRYTLIIHSSYPHNTIIIH
jgi:hypothetical protein